MDRGELDEAEKARGGFVVSGGEASEVLQEADHALDAVAVPVAWAVELAGAPTVRFPRDDGPCAVHEQGVPEVIAVIALVGEQGLRTDLDKLQSILCSRDISRLARRQVEGQRQPVRISNDMDLG